MSADWRTFTSDIFLPLFQSFLMFRRMGVATARLRPS